MESANSTLADKCIRRTNPKMKKRQLWTDIVRVFQEHKYNVTEDTLDLKMRNLKKTYRNIKDNNSKNRTGRNTVKWDYCDDFEDIFHDDKTTNFPTVLSSFPSSASSIPHISPQQTPPPLTTKTTPTTTQDSLFLTLPHQPSTDLIQSQ